MPRAPCACAARRVRRHPHPRHLWPERQRTSQASAFPALAEAPPGGPGAASEASAPGTARHGPGARWLPLPPASLQLHSPEAAAVGHRPNCGADHSPAAAAPAARKLKNLTFYPLPSQILQSTPWLSHIDRKQTTLREGLLLALRVRHQSCHCHLQPASFTDGSLVLRQLRGQVAEGRHSLASSMECMSVVTYLFRYFVACFFRSFVVSVFLSFLALSQLCFFCCSILCGFASFPASFLRCFVLSLCFSFT